MLPLNTLPFVDLIMTDGTEYFEYLKGRSRLGLFYRRFWLYPRIARHLRGRALDVGCGIGDMLRYRKDTIGVDINPATINWCRSQGLDARLMQIDTLPFESATFDSVILDNVLEHLTEPGPLLREIARVLVPGGNLVIGVPGKMGYTADPDHKRFYDEAALIQFGGELGYRLVTTFHTPFRSRWLDSNASPYCLYGVFTND